MEQPSWMGTAQLQGPAGPLLFLGLEASEQMLQRDLDSWGDSEQPLLTKYTRGDQNTVNILN